MKTNRQKRLHNKDFCEIFGYHAVYAALNNPKRKHQKLYVTKNQKKNLTKKLTYNVPNVYELQANEMLKMFGNESAHQGNILKTSKLKQPSLEEVIYNSRNNNYDIVFDAAGFEATRKKSIQCVKQGGTIIHIGLSQPAGEFDFRKATLQEVTFVGTYCYTNEDFKQ